MKYLAIILICSALVPTIHAEYTTNDWQTAQEQWKAARIAWTNEMAKAAAAGLVPPRKATKAKAGGLANVDAAPALTKAQQSYFQNRRICVGRDTTTLPGYVITTWHRNGKPDTKAPAVVTNRLQEIVGKEQKNPLQELIEQWRAAAEQYRASAEQWRETATNATARVERVNAALDERRAEYVEKRDKAALPTTKAIYQAFIDAIDRIKEKLNAEGN